MNASARISAPCGGWPMMAKSAMLSAKLLDDRITIGDRKADLNFRMRLNEFCQQLRHEIVGAADHRDIQVAAFQSLHLIKHRFHFLQQLQHRSGVMQQFGTRNSEMKLLADLFEQRQPDRTFRLLDLHRNGGLGQIQFRRRTRMVQMAGDALEDLQLAERNG